MNPEFERNLYLEFSFARLIGMPLFLGIIFALTYLLNDHQFDKGTATTALGLYIFIVFFWGARQTSESIFDELRNHTWDIQKTSAISPWSLTWGKLFGSTLFNWYGGLLCLIVYCFTTPKPESILLMIGYAISCGLLVQSLSLLVSLFSLRKKQAFNSSISYMFVLFLVFFISSITMSLENNSIKIINWYDFKIDAQIFWLISIVLAAAWSIVGIYRLLAQELQIRTLPWVWVLFIAFLVVYTHGLIVGNSHVNIQIPENALLKQNYLMLIAFGICIFLTYGLIFIDDNNPMLMRRLWVYSEEEKWQRFFEEVPCWLISLVAALPACLYLTLFHSSETMENLHIYPIPVFLLMIRDIAIVLFFNYAPNPKRAFGLSVLYLTFLYWIIPGIFIEAGATIIAALFLPLFSDNTGLAILFAGSQVGLIGYLLFNRWQKTVNQSQQHT